MIGMNLTAAETAIFALCATNIGALVWNTASQHVRLRALERTINNGISDAVARHSVQLAAIETRCRERHAGETE